MGSGRTNGQSCWAHAPIVQKSYGESTRPTISTFLLGQLESILVKKKKSVFFLILIIIVGPDFAFSTILVFLWDLVIFFKTFFSSLLKKNFFSYFLMEITNIWLFLHFATIFSLFDPFNRYLNGFLT